MKVYGRRTLLSSIGGSSKAVCVGNMSALSSHRMPDPQLEKLFLGLCRYKPTKRALDKLKKYPDRQTAVDFLVGKLTAFITETDKADQWDHLLEWGITHSCTLLAQFKADEACKPMIEMLDRVKDDWESELYNTIMLGLEGIGEPALEPAFEKYQKDKGHTERASVWVWVLANLGVKDARIRRVLQDHLVVDSDEAITLMGYYGDQSFLPIVESYVKDIAQYLNTHHIDPFAKGARSEDSLVSSYIDSRESLVMIKEGIPVTHPEFDAKVQELDRELLRHADFSVYDRPRNIVTPPDESTKIRRNDQCPCGSGKKYKKCCGNGTLN